MQIRPDFKYAPEEWKQEAFSMLKRSVHISFPVFFVFCFLLFGVAEFFNQFLIKSPSAISCFLFGALNAFLISFIYFPSSMWFFYLYHWDGGRKMTLPFMISHLKTVTNRYLFVAYNSRFILLTLMVVIFSLTSLHFYGRYIQKSVVYPEYNTLIYVVNSALSFSCLSSFIFLSSFYNRSILGILYIMLGVVDYRGAEMLTKQAYAQYPLVSQYITKLSFKSTFIMIGCFIIKSSVLSFIPNNVGVAINMLITLLMLVIMVYFLTLIYIVSRELYDGKAKKQTVEEKQPEIDAVLVG